VVHRRADHPGFSGPIHPTRGGGFLLFIGIVAIGFLTTGAPRAAACDVGDEFDATAEGLLRDSEPGGLGQATRSMSCKLLVPGPHLRVTTHREPTPADLARAGEIRAQIRQALAKYEDYRLAERDGFEIRFPNVQQKIYHFSNSANAAASYHQDFDPLRPVSLLYEKQKTGFRLVGVMYMAPQHASEESLDARFPISVAPWHLHTNMCIPVRGNQRRASGGPDSRFGPNGSIATAAACAAAGGQFRPVIYGWMTHVDFPDPAGAN